jgi:hypothetical protein
MSERVKGAFFCILPVVLLCVSVNPASADEVDDLLNKCEIASNPKPSVMVYDYKLSPETLMPGDVGVLTITLKNMQEEPIEKEVDIKDEIRGNYTTVEETTKEIERTSESDGPTWEHTIEKKVEPETRTIDIDTKTRFTMDAYITEAYIVENEFKVYNRYISAGVIGPDEKVDFTFKIKAPLEEGIYMLKFIADIEDTQGESNKGIRYFIPVIVSGTVNIVPLEVSHDEVKLEVINEGLSDIDSVFVAVSSMNGAECQLEKVYIGKINSGKSAIAVFRVIKAEEEEKSAVLKFKALYKNGINKHESDMVWVRIPYSVEEEKEKRGQLLEEQSETSFAPITTQPTPSSSNLASTSKLPWFGAVLAFAGLLVVSVMCMLLFKGKRKRKEVVKNEDE